MVSVQGHPSSGNGSYRNRAHTRDQRLPLHVALMRIRYSHFLLHTSLWEHPPSHSLSLPQPTCPWTRSGCPCGHATSLLRCHVLLPCQEVWVQVSQAVTAAHLLPGESPCPSICQYGCVWSPAWSSTCAPMGLKRATPKVWLDFFWVLLSLVSTQFIKTCFHRVRIVSFGW